MHNKILIILIIVLVTITIVFNLKIKEEPKKEEIETVVHSIALFSWWKNKYPPDFELELLNGEKFILSDYIGKKIIILNFFTTWCPPCKEEIPELISYYNRHKTNGLILLGINVNEKKNVVEKFVEEQKISFPIGIDNEEQISKKYHVKSFPITIFIGADGRIALYQIGAIYNADVIFENLYKINKDSLIRNKGIDKMTYLENLKNQPSFSVMDEYRPKEKIVLEGKSKEFATKMRCPSCGKNILNCVCDFCEPVKKKLKQMDLKNKRDEDILKELFLIYDKSR